MENEYKGKEISVKMLVDVLKKCFIFMIIAAVIIGTAAGVVTELTVQPTYKATIAMWVINTTVTTDYATSALTSAAAAIADSCTELVTLWLPAERAVSEYGLTEKLGYSSDAECIAAVRRSISASKKGVNSFIFYVTVETDSVNSTYEIAYALQKTLPSVLTELLDFKLVDEDTDNGTVTKNARTVVGPITSTGDVAPSRVSTILMTMLGAFLAAVAVYLVFIIKELFDNGIYDESAIKDNFEEPVIGIIPSWNTKSDELKKLRNKKDHYISRDYTGRLLTAEAPFAITESFNALRTNAVFAAASQKNPVFAVTSGYSGAGKSFVAANLAISMSVAGKKTLLVECDMRCPVFAKMFKLNDKAQGLSELLAGMVEKSEDVVATSEFGSFDIIYSGKIPPNPSELLSSERMAALVREWKEVYDVIILDMPPVCEVIDAGAVAGIVNGYIIAARSNYSDLSEVRAAVSRLDAVGGHLFGFIVNDVSLKGVGKYYKKGYYYYGSSKA